MKREWNADELAEQWSLRPEEKALLGNKNGATRLGFAVLLKYFQHEGRFPRQRQEVPHVIIRYLARHIGVAISEWSDYLWQRRTLEYHRAQIREFLGFGEATVEDSNSLSNWLVGHILAKDQNPDHIASEIINRRRALHIEPPAPDRFDRIIRSALSAFEKQFCDAITERLSPQTCERLDALLSPDITGHEGGASPPEQMRAVLTGLLADPGAAKLENLLEMTQRL